MELKILDGKGLAQIAEQEIKNQVSELKDKGVTPTLATVLVGVDPWYLVLWVASTCWFRNFLLKS